MNDPAADQRRCFHVQCTISLGCCCNWKSGRINNRLQHIRNSIPIQEPRTLSTSRNHRTNSRRNIFGGSNTFAIDLLDITTNYNKLCLVQLNNLYYSDHFLATSRNIRGELVPPPPPAYIDIFPDNPNLIEEVNQFNDTSSQSATTSSVQSNDVISSLHAVLSESDPPINENTTHEYQGV